MERAPLERGLIVANYGRHFLVETSNGTRDLRRRTVDRFARSAGTELETEKAKGAGTDGRADSGAAQTCARAGNFRVGSV